MKISIRKTIIKVLFALLFFVLPFYSCNGNVNITPEENSSTDNSNSQNSNPTYTPVDDTDLENMSALQFTKVMGNGINLGNTFESNAANWVGYNASPSAYETGWGQPVTTKAIFEAYKAAGFDCVRIPIAWTSTIDWRNNDYVINQDFMNRIKEVVGFALDSDLYVMINDHWDYGWWGLFGSDKTKAYKIFDAIWDQVGTEFKDFDYRLIFEAGNEEWGHRFNDEVDGKTGTLTLNQQYELITELGQHFVDKIRNQGNKNEKRFLVIPGYNTDFEKTCDSRYIMPTDSTNSVQKLILSVHYYSPAPYALVSDPNNLWGFTRTWGSSSDISTQNSLFKMLRKFTNDGYGVLIGEYAPAMEQTEGLDTPDIGNDDVYIRKNGDVEWITNILDNCDTYNYVPFLWDCNGYFKKNGTIGFADSDIAAIYKNRNYAAEKANTSTGNKITDSTITIYTADSIVLAPTSEKDAVEKTITLNNVSVASGKEITITYTRPEISRDYAQHLFNLYTTQGLVSGSDTWCTTALYPPKEAGTITQNFTAKTDLTLTNFKLYINSPQGENVEVNSSLTITNVKIVVE